MRFLDGRAARMVGRSIGLIVCAVHIFATSGAGAERVVVHTRQGRILTGEVDAQTSRSRLWLRLTEPNIVVLSQVDWGDVARVEANGHRISAEEFLPEAERQKSLVLAGVFAKPRIDPAESGAADLKRTTPRVRALRIEAELANWDGDAEVDGFEVRVYPLAADRSVVPVAGMLRAQLFGQNITPDQMFEPMRGDYDRLEQWSQRVSVDDFSAHEAVIRLPFRSIHPEFEVDVRNNGQLNASLSVDGHGVYDATVPVTMRTYSPIRERLQQTRRDRFFPGERTGVFAKPFLGIFPGDVTGR
ncbi:MAG: hypothetical protein HY290_28670 [Planctomycetia bacterium]|nr:hypothetical protein [Planctomycetia bacterium]